MRCSLNRQGNYGLFKVLFHVVRSAIEITTPTNRDGDDSRRSLARGEDKVSVAEPKPSEIKAFISYLYVFWKRERKPATQEDAHRWLKRHGIEEEDELAFRTELGAEDYGPQLLSLVEKRKIVIAKYTPPDKAQTWERQARAAAKFFDVKLTSGTKRGATTVGGTGSDPRRRESDVDKLGELISELAISEKTGDPPREAIWRKIRVVLRRLGLDDEMIDEFAAHTAAPQKLLQLLERF